MVSIACVANNKLPVYKTIIIDINKLDRNLTNLQNTSISECASNTTAQLVNDQNIIIIETNKSMKQKMRNLLLMKLAKTQQDEQEEETDGPLNEHRAPTKETCIQAIIIDHQNAYTGNEI